MKADVVEVVFVDADTAQEIGRSRLPAEQLPDTFAVATTVEVGDESWSVISAEPPTAAQFVAAGRVVLTLGRVDRVAAREILYSLPTICDLLPGYGPDRPGDRYEIHEDDWRQVELVSRALADEVNSESQAIGEIYTHHARENAQGSVYGFDAIHVRTGPAQPLGTGLAWRGLQELLPSTDRRFTGFGYRDAPGVVEHSFVLGIEPVIFYGLLDGDQVTVFCIGIQPDRPVSPNPDLAAALARVMRSFDLHLVDWCRRAAVDAFAVGGWLATAVTY